MRLSLLVTVAVTRLVMGHAEDDRELFRLPPVRISDQPSEVPSDVPSTVPATAQTAIQSVIPTLPEE